VQGLPLEVYKLPVKEQIAYLKKHPELIDVNGVQMPTKEQLQGGAAGEAAGQVQDNSPIAELRRKAADALAQAEELEKQAAQLKKAKPKDALEGITDILVDIKQLHKAINDLSYQLNYKQEIDGITAVCKTINEKLDFLMGRPVGLPYNAQAAAQGVAGAAPASTPVNPDAKEQKKRKLILFALVGGVILVCLLGFIALVI
jgi:hypothetical protein